MKMQFVSYDGKYPSLCSGTLTIKLNGKKKTFGLDADYPKFWCSGGSCGFYKKYEDPYTIKNEWEMLANEHDYPKYIWKAMPQMLELMNEHVPFGCCGGCL